MPEKLATAWAKVVDGKRCVTTAYLCDLMGVSREALSKWNEKGCPKVRSGWWSLEEVLRWRGVVGTQGATDQAETLGYREQKLRADADLKRITVAKEAIRLNEMKGEYVSVQEVRALWTSLFVVLRRSLLSLCKVVAMEASAYVDLPAARRIEQAVREVVTDALENLAENGVYNPPARRRRKPGRPRKTRVA